MQHLENVQDLDFDLGTVSNNLITLTGYTKINKAGLEAVVNAVKQTQAFKKLSIGSGTLKIKYEKTL